MNMKYAADSLVAGMLPIVLVCLVVIVEGGSQSMTLKWFTVQTHNL